jgi:hypothetical protein
MKQLYLRRIEKKRSSSPTSPGEDWGKGTDQTDVQRHPILLPANSRIFGFPEDRNHVSQKGDARIRLTSLTLINEPVSYILGSTLVLARGAS